MSDSTAANYTPQKYLAGTDGWNPVGEEIRDEEARLLGAALVDGCAGRAWSGTSAAVRGGRAPGRRQPPISWPSPRAASASTSPARSTDNGGTAATVGLHAPTAAWQQFTVTGQHRRRTTSWSTSTAASASTCPTRPTSGVQLQQYGCGVAARPTSSGSSPPAARTPTARQRRLRPVPQRQGRSTANGERSSSRRPAPPTPTSSGRFTLVAGGGERRPDLVEHGGRLRLHRRRHHRRRRRHDGHRHHLRRPAEVRHRHGRLRHQGQRHDHRTHHGLRDQGHVEQDDRRGRHHRPDQERRLLPRHRRQERHHPQPHHRRHRDDRGRPGRQGLRLRRHPDGHRRPRLDRPQHVPEHQRRHASTAARTPPTSPSPGTSWAATTRPSASAGPTTSPPG